MNKTEASIIVRLVEGGNIEAAKIVTKEILSGKKNTDTKKAKKASAWSINNPQLALSEELASLFAKVVDGDNVSFVPKNETDVVEFGDKRFYGGAKSYKVADLMEQPLLNAGEVPAEKLGKTTSLVPARFYFEACDRV